MKAPNVMTEPITLRNTAETISSSAARYWTANMITIGMDGMAVVSTALLTIGLPWSSHRKPPRSRAGWTMFFRNTQNKTYRLTLILRDASTIPEPNRAMPPAAFPSKDSEWTMSFGMPAPLSTVTKARTGAQTIGSLTVSVSLAASTEPQVAG